MAERCGRCGRELCGKPDECRDEPYLCHLEGGPDCTEWAVRTRSDLVLVPAAPPRRDIEVFEMDGAAGTRRVVVIDCGAVAEPPAHGMAEAVMELRRNRTTTPWNENLAPDPVSTGLEDLPQRLTKAENENQMRDELRRRQGRRNRW